VCRTHARSANVPVCHFFIGTLATVDFGYDAQIDVR